ncbi:hypothetical protein DV704_04865 [Meiothermus sp. QL-1]|uniref:hypothetical protein n=1 Tax=Meiothermus sp. QL-1 TaxID=2058095 RepID=UPI000E0C470D|nr:hypothetical protein [Meiothermus sp. QL-1]RDI95618.1 hypothetical protein DV704_04865 [Meiothermus sp. QL-1]
MKHPKLLQGAKDLLGRLGWRPKRSPTSTDTEAPRPSGVPRPLELSPGCTANLGARWGHPLLQGLLLLGTPEGARLQQLPEGLALRAPEALGVGDILPWDEVAWVYHQARPLLGLAVVPPRQATPARWGKAFCALDGHLISLELGGLKPFDLGRRLNLPVLHNLCLALGRGGLRLLGQPATIALHVEGAPIARQGLVPFGQAIQLMAGQKPLGELLFLAFEGVPEPRARLDYLGSSPESRRQHLVLMQPVDLGQADPALERLCLAPEPGGVRLLHSPGHLLIYGLGGARPCGALAAIGETLLLVEMSSRACLGVLEVLEP